MRKFATTHTDLATHKPMFPRGVRSYWLAPLAPQPARTHRYPSLFWVLEEFGTPLVALSAWHTTIYNFHIPVERKG